MKILNKYWLLLIMLILSPYLINASPTTPVSKETVINNSIFLINNWENISFKHQKADDGWISNYVNPILDPKGLNWDTGEIGRAHV